MEFKYNIPTKVQKQLAKIIGFEINNNNNIFKMLMNELIKPIEGLQKT